MIGSIENFYYIVPKPDSNEISLRKEKISFKWSDTNLSFVNTFRRILLSDISTFVLGNFQFYNYALPNIQHNEHSKYMPVMHNEQIKLVLELIPVSQKYKNVEVYLGTREQAYTVPQNHIGLWEDLYTDKLIVRNLDDNSFIPNNEFFPNRILITRLKKNQQFGFRCSLVSGKGSQNAKHTPVCSASFSYMEDSNTLQKYDSEYNRTQIIEYPTEFNFVIHTLSYWTPEETLLKAFDEFENIIKRNRQKIKDISETKLFETKETHNGKLCITFKLDNESHTIGAILQSYILQMLPEDGFVGYKNDHPKKKTIDFCITTETELLVDADGSFRRDCIIFRALDKILDDILKNKDSFRQILFA